MIKVKTPRLPEIIGQKYECTIVPTTVVIQKGEAKGSYDLTRITEEEAKKLAKAGKYLREKSSPKVAEKGK